MRDFVSLAVRGDKEFAKSVRRVAQLRGQRVGDYLRTLILEDCAADPERSFFASVERRNERAMETTLRGER